MISEAIKATKEATDQGEGVNSIVSILSLSKPASLKEVSNSDSAGLLQLVRAEMSEMRSDFRRTMFIMERDRERSMLNEGSLFPSRIREVRSMIREAEIMLSKEAPKELVMGLIGEAQKRLMGMLQSDIPKEFRGDVQDIFTKCEKLERELINQSK